MTAIDQFKGGSMAEIKASQEHLGREVTPVEMYCIMLLVRRGILRFELSR